MRHTFITSALAAVITFVAAGAVTARAEDPRSSYKDYHRMVEGTTAQLKPYLKEHPEVLADSLEARILPFMSEGSVAPRSVLTPPRKKRLTPEQVYEQGRRSSLAFGKMEHVSYLNTDSAYTNASAVALTPDGICVTNYHVVNDLVLRGAFDYHAPYDRMRFVMDCDGNAFPVTDVLGVDILNDLAIIRVDTRGHKLTPAPVADDAPVGAAVYCLANPSGKYFQFTEGVVANRTATLNRQTGHNKYILEITSDYGVGASGGPIFDQYGNLVSLVSSTFSLYAEPEQFRNFQMTYKLTVPGFLIKDKFKD
ncbi:MAG: serine protease [Duncaniella sp.]|nr:trypsin-like peptidase domain-containing protein [Bacteroides sp.]MDE6067123.1 serine protease [Duncaniella sp.]